MSNFGRNGETGAHWRPTKREVPNSNRKSVCSAVRCATTAEPIDLPFGSRTRVCPGKHKFNRIRQVVPICPHGRAHWRYLANTIEPSVCCGDAALCQITLTTCSAGCLRFQPPSQRIMSFPALSSRCCQCCKSFNFRPYKHWK